MTREACWYISDLRLERIPEEELDHYTGWNVGGKDRIAFSGSGYQTGSMKTAIMCEPEIKTFRLVNSKTGMVALEKAVETVHTVNGEFQIMNFSEVGDPGDYFLAAGRLITKPFPIGDSIWEGSVWKTVNFFFCERCGCHVPNKHFTCCIDQFFEHDGLKVPANGGWHDAGDMSQNLSNTAEITVSLFEIARTVGENTHLRDRLIEEGRWGLDWMLKTRFSDGYRGMQDGGSYWTDGIIENGDDRIHRALNMPIDNFMAAGAEAIGYQMLKDADPVYANYALKCAKEDWDYAYRDRAIEGYEFNKTVDPGRASHPIVMYSVAVWSALDIYEADGDEYFRDMAQELAAEILACQQQEIPDWEIPFTGFFYRDSEKKLIVHYNHRSHENEPLLALSRLCRSFPEHRDWIKWYYGIVLYSEYFRKAAEYTAPYYMSPASIYSLDEVGTTEKERALFVAQQATAGEESIADFEAQVKNGIPLGKGFYLRRFPVWYAFRGNHALTLSGGIASAQAALARGDYGLAELAQRQLEWIVGKKPFAESMMFGEGYDFCQEYAVLPGEMVGELGVGIETLDDRDEPYWPQVNTCTYKEVWVHNPLRYAWLCALTYGNAKLRGQLKKNAGDIVFHHKVTGKEYAFTPNPDNGYFYADVPSGEYIIAYDGRQKNMTLLSSASYMLDGALADYTLNYALDGSNVSVTIKTSGEGAGRFELRTENMSFTDTCREFTYGDTLRFEGRIDDARCPYLAVFIPNGNMNDKLEVFGQ